MFRVEKRGERVAVLRIDDGKVNAIGPDFLVAFQQAWAEATREGRAVVLAGNAKAFSAGLDLKVLPGLERREMLAFGRGFMQLFHDVLAYPRPVVAALDGPAIAGGAILALCADFRLVGPKARVGVTEVPVGIPFPLPVVDLVRERLPAFEHAPALMRGVVRAGEDCVRAGWAHQFVESDRLVDEAVALADELAAHYPLAFASAKGPLSEPLAARYGRFVKEDADAWVDVVMSEATMEAIVESFVRATSKREAGAAR